MSQEETPSLSDATLKRYAKEHASLCDQVEQLERIVRIWPNDAWACGQLRYFRERVQELSKFLGQAQNRVQP